jgi:hypothetical protein
MLRDGVIAHELRIDDLTAAAQSVEVQARGLADAAVARLGAGAERVVRQGTATLFVVAPGRAAQDLARGVLDAGGTLDGLMPRRASLEDALVALGALPATPGAGASPAAAATRLPALPTIESAPPGRVPQEVR